MICLEHDYHGERSCPTCDGAEAARKAFGSSNDKPSASEEAFEAWWQRWREANCYPNTERMRDAARAVYLSLAYGGIDTAVEQLRAAGHLKPAENIDDAEFGMREHREAREAERPTARSAVVASVTEDGFKNQIHSMLRQSQMLAEEGNDISSRVMADAAKMVADVWKDRERYRQGMANWKATAEAKDREYARSATEACIERCEKYLHGEAIGSICGLRKLERENATKSVPDRNATRS